MKVNAGDIGLWAVTGGMTVGIGAMVGSIAARAKSDPKTENYQGPPKHDGITGSEIGKSVAVAVAAGTALTFGVVGGLVCAGMGVSLIDDFDHIATGMIGSMAGVGALSGLSGGLTCSAMN